MGRAQIKVHCVLFWPNVVFQVLLKAHFLGFAFQQRFWELKVYIYVYMGMSSFRKKKEEVQKCSIDLF